MYRNMEKNVVLLGDSIGRGVVLVNERYTLLGYRHLAVCAAKKCFTYKIKCTMKKNCLVWNLLLVFLFPVFAVYGMWQEMRE